MKAKLQTSYSFNRKSALFLAGILILWNHLWLDPGTLVVSVIAVAVVAAVRPTGRLVSVIFGLIVGFLLPCIALYSFKYPSLRWLADQDPLTGFIMGALVGDLSWHTLKQREHAQWQSSALVAVYSICFWVFWASISGSMQEVLRHSSRADLRHWGLFGYLDALAPLHGLVLPITSLPSAVILASLPTRRFSLLLPAAIILITPILLFTSVLSVPFFLGPLILMKYLSDTKAVLFVGWAVFVAILKMKLTSPLPKLRTD